MVSRSSWPKRQPLQPHDDERRQVLVVEELRHAGFDLRQPVVEDVVANRQRVGGPLDEQVVERVVVQRGNRDGQLREERDRVDDRRHEDDQREDELLGPAQGAGRIVTECATEPFERLAHRLEASRRGGALNGRRGVVREWL